MDEFALNLLHYLDGYLLQKESAKLRVLRAKKVLMCLGSLHAHLPTCLASSHALRAYVLTCQRALSAYVATCFASSRATTVFTLSFEYLCLTYQNALRV